MKYYCLKRQLLLRGKGEVILCRESTGHEKGVSYGFIEVSRE